LYATVSNQRQLNCPAKKETEAVLSTSLAVDLEFLDERYLCHRQSTELVEERIGLFRGLDP
jgi:hypothetical protein